MRREKNEGEGERETTQERQRERERERARERRTDGQSELCVSTIIVQQQPLSTHSCFLVSFPPFLLYFPMSSNKSEHTIQLKGHR